MSEIATLIVDDERHARQRLARLLRDHRDIRVIGECENGAAALESIRRERPDLLLVDIEMPGLDGIELAERLPCDDLPIIVFVTAYDEHAIRAFDACALDYLLKPVSAERLAKTLGRVRAHLAAREAAAPRRKAAPAEPAKFQVRTGQRTLFVAPEEIDWIEADGNYAVLHVGPRSHMLRATMATLETELPHNFLRTSRSAIVNLRRVKELQSAGDNHFAILPDNQRVPITRSIREVRKLLSAV